MEETSARAITCPIPFKNLNTTTSIGKRKAMDSCSEPDADIATELIHVPGVSYHWHFQLVITK
jgi:hypothetical protein